MRIDQYLSAVGEQIRWKRARKPLLAELESHILDCRDSLVADGMTEEEAEINAVERMGDPVETGTLLDSVHRPRPDWRVIVCFASLLFYGTALVWLSFGHDPGIKMLLIALCAIPAAVLGYFLDYTRLARFPKALFFSLIALCTTGQYLTGQPNGSITISQLGYAVPLAYGVLLWSLRGGGDSKASLTKRLLFAYIAGAVCITAGIFSHAGFGVIIYDFVCCYGIFLYAVSLGIFGTDKKRNTVICAVPLVLSLALVVLLLTGLYTALGRRLSGALYPYSDPYLYGYLSVLMRELVYNSRMLGEGGAGTYGFITAVEQQGRTDFFSREYALAYSAHRLGWLTIAATAAMAAALFFFVARGIKRQSCLLGKLTAFPVMICFAVRTAQYFVTNLGFELFTLDGLPLFSYNGKLMILDAFMAGLLLSVFRTESISRDSVPSLHVNTE